MGDFAWVEVSLVVDGELAEAVADVLARYVPNGVVVESTQIVQEAEGEGYPVGPLRVCGYLPVDDQLEATRHKLEEALWYLGRISPLPPATFKPIQEVNWFEAWKQHYHPIAIGQRLIIVPAWMEVPTEGRLPIRIDPGMAFGTGTHPTTQMCLELVEAAFDSGPRPAVIDIGCGSGILSVAALKLGAEAALGVDIDPQAVAASRENATANGVAERLELGVGSIAEVQAGKFGLHQGQVVFANILAHVLARLFDEGLGDLVAPEGVAILSGILAEQEFRVLEAAGRHGFVVVDRRQMGDWVALAVEKV